MTGLLIKLKLRRLGAPASPPCTDLVIRSTPSLGYVRQVPDTSPFLHGSAMRLADRLLKRVPRRNQTRKRPRSVGAWASSAIRNQGQIVVGSGIVPEKPAVLALRHLQHLCMELAETQFPSVAKARP